MSTLAITYSLFHQELLKQNLESNAIKILSTNRKDSNYFESTYIGKEIFNINIFYAWVNNKKYYSNISNFIEQNGINKIILFNCNTSLSHYIYNKYKGQLSIELWEDGLEHYILDYGGLNYYLKSIVKFILGAYKYNIFLKDFRNLKKLTIRNRFEYKNLKYNYIDCPKKMKINKLLFIGQPLIEDNIMSMTRYISNLEIIASLTDYEVDYIPHPRESKILESNIKGINILKNEYSTEKYLEDKEYRFYLSVYSTVLLNINRFNKSYYLANIFGLNRISNKMNRLDFLPIKSPINLGELYNEINCYKDN
jgi:hypothetical protein